MNYPGTFNQILFNGCDIKSLFPEIHIKAIMLKPFGAQAQIHYSPEAKLVTMPLDFFWKLPNQVAVRPQNGISGPDRMISISSEAFQ